MMVFLRLTAICLVALTVVYVCLLLFARARKRERLEEAWLVAGQPQTRARHVDDKLDAFTALLRRRLIWGVYVVPLCAIAALIYFTNIA